MASLRKKVKEMAEGDKRRSARLQTLEELKSKKAVLALPAENQQRRTNGPTNMHKRGKRMKKEIDGETQRSQEDGSSINGTFSSASHRATDRIIGYILDILEVKDTHELFSMPDNLQTYDYEESMNQPGDFATLRQKHTDKMYSTLDHFENDVLSVFQKAIHSNDPSSIPFREAMAQRDQAKQIFQSLKNNLSYTELELSDWHQNYFNDKRKTLRNDPRIGNSNTSSQPEHCTHLSNPTSMKQHRGATNSARARRKSLSTSSLRPRSRKASGIEHDHPQFPKVQPRDSYNAENDSNEPLFTTFCIEPKTFIYNSNGLSYKESLRQFVKDAGPIAKLVAEEACLEYSKRATALSLWRPSPFGSQSKLGDPTSFSPTSQSQHSESFGTVGQQAYDEFEYQACQLHTDELLTLFSARNIGKPEFIQTSSSSSSRQCPNPMLGFSPFLQGSGATTRSRVHPTVHIVPCSNFKPEPPADSKASNELPIWQPRFGGSKPWKERESKQAPYYGYSGNGASPSAN